jgi:hypothetical protein
MDAHRGRLHVRPECARAPSRRETGCGSVTHISESARGAAGRHGATAIPGSRSASGASSRSPGRETGKRSGAAAPVELRSSAKSPADDCFADGSIRVQRRRGDQSSRQRRPSWAAGSVREQQSQSRIRGAGSLLLYARGAVCAEPVSDPVRAASATQTLEVERRWWFAVVAVWWQQTLWDPRA